MTLKKTIKSAQKFRSNTALNTESVTNPVTDSEMPPKRAKTAFSAAADGLIAAAKSKATKLGYASDMRHWMSNGGSLPAKPIQVVEYLAKFAGILSVATLERRLIAICQAHREISIESPTRDMAVRSTMQGIRRTHGKRTNQARPILKDDLLEALIFNDAQNPIKAARDRALLLLGFAGAFRRAELVALTVEDIKQVDNGIEIFIARSKTDQAGEGDIKFIPCANGTRCPVVALAEWLTVAEITEGHIFRAVSRHDRVSEHPLTPQSVRLVVKSSVARVDGSLEKVSAHSLRAGYITQAAMSGHQIWQIKLVSLHASDTVVAGYIRPINKRKVPSLL
jgi:site-specific recombinase XerD